MDCRILRQLTLKADGHLGCDDSRGYKIDLGNVVDSRGWKLRQTLNAPIYRHIRSSFAAGAVPWPGTCEKCDLLSDGAAAVDTLDHRIDLLVEPTLACDLSCACCMRKAILAGGRDNRSLDPAILHRLVQACKTEGIELGEVNYSGQGEPLKHDNFRGLLHTVKSGMPLAQNVVTTTGNVEFAQTVGDSPLDKLIVSCDGADSDSYPRYRKGGALKSVMTFLEDSRRYGRSDLFVEWKYILFDFNDSDAEILRAQSLAESFGIDSILFIITNSKWHSNRYTVDSIDQFPLRSPLARVSPAAAFGAVACENSHFGSDSVPAAFGQIDVCNVTVGKILNVEGWAAESTTELAEAVELLVDGRLVGRSKLVHQRADVKQAYPGMPSSKCGFIFRFPVNPNSLPTTVEVRVLGRTGSSLMGGTTHWRFPQVKLKRRSDLGTVDAMVERPLVFFRNKAQVPVESPQM